MKRITFLMTGLLVLMLACDNPVNNVPEDAPDVFRELVDLAVENRVDEVTAHVYGSFSITFEGEPGVITDGPANFPGNPKNAGYCKDGLWSNPKGKPTSGSLDNPHPHCVGTGSESVIVILEPISVFYEKKPSGPLNETLFFTKDEIGVKRVGAGNNDTKGEGVILAYAIDAETIGGDDDTTPRRVGTLEINLSDYNVNYDLFLEGCTMGDEGDEDYFTTEARCLNKIISADYKPYGDDSVGYAKSVQGFLYWKPANQPFNY